MPLHAHAERVIFYVAKLAKNADEIWWEVGTGMDIGARLKELRGQREITQEQRAKRANLPNTTISKIENGTRQMRAAEAFVIAQALNISPNQFYGIEPVPPPPQCGKVRKVQRLMKRLKKTTEDLVSTLETS